MYATIQEVKDGTSFNEVSSLSDTKIQSYIDRATSWIHRVAKKSFESETDPYLLTDLKTATILLVEYLWFWDQSEVKEGAFDQIESEKLGSYSYKVKETKAAPGEETGNKELDSILDSLKPRVIGVSFFSVSGPTRMNSDEV